MGSGHEQLLGFCPVADIPTYAQGLWRNGLFWLLCLFEHHHTGVYIPVPAGDQGKKPGGVGLRVRGFHNSTCIVSAEQGSSMVDQAVSLLRQVW